ncbi:diadenylate cyclase CdaA [candidate division WOR-3 bacterium]|nr:diadenylate cyclase CdaA [candidate division WOR-3 bacterium]MCK4575537.1 diadenylate cyclase CdaA [candidate division WOR-3 bacterium]
MQFINFTTLDFIDIVIVSFVFYQILKFVKGTRAIQMLIGLAFVLLFALIANMWQMQGLKWIVDGVKTIWIIAFVIVFQPEIRRALTNIGRTRLVRFFLKETREEIVDELVRSAKTLSERGLGALIVIKRRVGLKGYLETGKSLEAKVSSDLIVTIFSPYSPLHDGAVVVDGSTIIGAGCVLPLSLNPLLDISVGTRHRAAIGITEETDTVAIVVSHETREISFAQKGKLLRGLDTASLKRNLEKAMRY